MIKKYIAKGLLEFRMTINVGGAMVRIPFTDGAMGYNGIIPASFITDNAALQAMIEDSRQFIKGVITEGKYIERKNNEEKKRDEK